MEHSFLRKFGPLIGFAAVGLACFLMLYRDVSPRASVDLKFTRTEIMIISQRYVEAMGFNLKNYQQDAWFGFDGKSHIFLQNRLQGTKKANRAVRADSLAMHNWYVTWYDRSFSQSQNPELFEAWISPSGKMLGFNHVINDTISRPSLSKEDAQRVAERFLLSKNVDLAPYDLKTSSDTKLAGRTDYFFKWTTRDTTVESQLWVRILGNEVGGFRFDFSPAAAFQQQFSQIETTVTFVVTASFAGVFLLFFFIIILFLKKYHEGEVGTKTAVMVFIGLLGISILLVANEYASLGAQAQMGDLNKYNVRLVMFALNVFIVQVFFSVMAFAAWSVGESSSRSAWNHKLVATDSILFRKFFTLDVAESLLRGFAWGLIILGGYTVLLKFLIDTLHIGTFSQSAGRATDAIVPALQPFLDAVAGAILLEIVFRFFFISFVKEKTGKQWLGVLVSTAVWTLAAFSLWDSPYGFLQLPQHLLVLVGFGLIFSFLFLRYDLLTTITAHFVIVGLNQAIPLFSSTGPSVQITHFIVPLTLAIPLFVAAGGFIRRQRFEFTPSTLPAHIQRISERVRMAKELEIARRVQMSLLPKSSPSAIGYDIAGTCIPAMEVGGDYYDFVNLGSRKIGIAIGDVSGKGVPAAIYMTLTKGILQSHAEENVSPKRVLSKVNNLMYRTIDRNSFVSMFYAILDLEERRIRFARAGQCPVIVAQHEDLPGTFLTPKGMALGLEVGTVFDSVLEEQELELRTGEVLVFYTDGFTEAMNEANEEFGETQLVEAIRRHRHKPAKDIINGICDDVTAFTKGWQQHDDMTMVVVKVG